MPDTVEQIAGKLSEGPTPDEYHRRELPGKGWVTCRGCSALRVSDFHYFYCRRLGDQTKPDAWNAGWHRIDKIVWPEAADVPCGLPVQHLLDNQKG